MTKIDLWSGCFEGQARCLHRARASACEVSTMMRPGIAELAAFCRQHGVALVVMEATGGYERRAFLLLWEAGIACALTNPAQRAPLRRGDGHSGEDRPDRRLRHRPLRRSPRT